MPQKSSLFCVLVGCLLVAGCFRSVAQTENAIVGTWLTEGKESHIEIYRQGKQFFGKVIWLRDPNKEDGKPKTDGHNPDASLKNRPIIGLVILKDFVFDQDNEWDGGTIYDPKNGKTYSCRMTLTKPNQLDVRGYVGVSFIGRTTKWTRVN